MNSLYPLAVRDIRGETVSLEGYRGKVLLIVNTASACGYTPQYEGLEKLYAEYKDRGFVVLGFPCNQFGGQEPGDEATIATFCEARYNVTFPMFAKVDVNGSGASPVFQWLKSEKPGILGTEAIKWNFTKFLVGRDGRALARYGSRTTPAELREDIDRALAG